MVRAEIDRRRVVQLARALTFPGPASKVSATTPEAGISPRLSSVSALALTEVSITAVATSDTATATAQPLLRR